jgi:hypothetical protein
MSAIIRITDFIPNQDGIFDLPQGIEVSSRMLQMFVQNELLQIDSSFLRRLESIIFHLHGNIPIRKSDEYEM